jgi:hypothetical protein
VGVGILGLIVVFLVVRPLSKPAKNASNAPFVAQRRWRKRSADKNAFNATNFRRSALLLDESFSEKPNSGKPRPPTMIERRMANVPAPPPASYGYDDQPQYGVDPYAKFNAGNNGSQYSGGQRGNEHNYTGDQFGATVDTYGQAAGYGAYGAPPTHTPHPQYPQQQQQQHFPQQYSFSPGQVIPSQRSSPPSTGYSEAPNPFAPAATVSAAAVVAAARSAASAPGPAPRHVSPTQQPQSNVYLSRQPTQAGGAPPAYPNEAGYADVQRDVKVAPLAVTNATPRSPGVELITPAASGAGTDARQRPLSTYTIYDPEDAYGGI